jgi:3'(2'), 5'-bisphosphate nucleotidase
MDGSHKRTVQASQRRDAPDNLLFLDSVKLSEPEQAAARAVREAAGLGEARLELYDSQLKYAMIAAGYGDVFIRMPRDIVADPHKVWDHAAGAALLQAGGGKITDTDGNTLDFSQGETLPHFGFIATNGNPNLHDILVRAVHTAIR